MTTERERWTRLRERTAATPDEVERVASRVRIPPDVEVGRMLGVLPGSDPLAERRILGRVAGRRRRWRFATLVAPLAGGLAAAAALALWLLRPEPPPGYDQILDSPAEWRHEQPTDALTVSYQGTGRLVGGRHVADVEWQVGTLQLSLSPEADVDLTVHTAEARVHVSGTRFEVTRDARGTRVSVIEGRVEAACTGSDAAVLVAGAELSCLPGTAPGLLGRARTLAAEGRPPAEVLVAAEAGLALTRDPVVVEELRLVRLQALIAADRRAEALAAARAGAGVAGHRRTDFMHAEARLAWDEEGCAGAAPTLRELAAANLIDDAERERLAWCERALDASRPEAHERKETPP